MVTDPRHSAAQFPVLERLAYLNAGTEGPVPRAAAAGGARADRSRERSEGRCGRPYFDGRDGDGRASCASGYAGVLGCEPSELALTGSTTDGVNTVIAGLDLRAGDEVLTTDEEHPGLLAPLGRARRRHGISVRVVPFAELPGEVSPSTRLIACSHVSWVSGRVIDVAALRATGVPVLLDAAQAIGAIPVDVDALGCDFYAASGQKWLCGPEGSGCLYVRPDRLDELLVAVAGLRLAGRSDERARVRAGRGNARASITAFRPACATRGRSRRCRCSPRPGGTGSTSARATLAASLAGQARASAGSRSDRAGARRSSRGRPPIPRPRWRGSPSERLRRALHPRVRSGPRVGRRVELRGGARAARRARGGVAAAGACRRRSRALSRRRSAAGACRR